ncbi:MAG: serine/threonine protein kinase with repeat [Pedosphaera sp.]|nr:serine/threonine protein kinase with repeat [Pedosphaera sp.]
MTKKKKTILILLGCLVPVLVLGIFLAFLAFRPPDIPVKFWVGAFSPDGKAIITIGGQSSLDDSPHVSELIRWSLPKGRRKTLLVQEAPIRTLVCSPDGKFVVLGDWRGVTKLVDPATGRIIRFLSPHSVLVNAVAVSKDSRMIATSCIDGTITLCDSTGKELETLTAPGEIFLNVAISPDCGHIAGTTKSGKVWLFDLATHQPARMLEAYGGRPLQWPRAEAVAFSPDGSSFVTGCQKSLRVWETSTGNLIRELRGSSGNVNSAAYSPNGDALATVDADGTLALWNPATGEQINSTSAHQGTCFWVAFSPDGKFLATVGRFDFTLDLRDAQTLGLITAFHRTTAIPTPSR